MSPGPSSKPLPRRTRLIAATGRRIAGLGLVGKVMLLSLVPIVLLGLALARTTHHRLAARSLTDANQAALLLARVGVWPNLTPRDLAHGISPAHRRALDRVLTRAIGTDIARIKVWNTDGVVVYSDDPSLIGRHLTPSPDLQTALQGHEASDISMPSKAENVGERRLGRLLEVYTPLRFSPDGKPAGAFELYLPYEPVAKGIASDTHMIIYMLLLGLGVLWAILFRIVAGASRTLRRQSDENRHQARHDALTGLPNRAAFNEALTDALGEDLPGGLGVVLLDLDRFKEINDTLGHQIGDQLLQQVGPRLASVIRPGDTIARLGGDEFGLLLPGLGSREKASEVTRKALTALELPFAADDLALHVGASAGIAFHPVDGDDAETLVRRADVAMYLAKDSREGLAHYDPARDANSADRLSLLGELRQSIDDGELVVHYQPKAELATGRITAVEALVRWQHPRRGLIPPAEFIDLAEQSGLIRGLTLYVLDRALADCVAFQQAGLDLGVAVNVSVRNLLDAELPDQIEELLERYPEARGRLELEITETDIMADVTRATAVLRRLSGMGIALAIDDFGTGYSSLARINSLQVQTVKIDKSFVLGMLSDEGDAAIVRSTIELAGSLGLRVVAEGVETEYVWNSLRDLGCDFAQGYFLSRPVPLNEAIVLIADRGAAGATSMSALAG